jgi:hypothetical protein
MATEHGRARNGSGNPEWSFLEMIWILKLCHSFLSHPLFTSRLNYIDSALQPLLYAKTTLL